MNYRLKKISGDASFREFYRLKKNNKTSIIVSAKKEKFKNLIVYSVVNKILNSNKITAPKLISNHYKNNNFEDIIKLLLKQNFKICKKFIFPTMHYQDVLFKKI